MPQFQIFADSMCDLPMGYAAQNNVAIIPAHYTLGDVEYADTHEDGPNHEYYDKMRAGEVPVTSQVIEQQYLDGWMTYVEQGVPIVHMCFSSQLSGTANSAFLARNEVLARSPQAQIFIVDSLSAALGFGLLVISLVKMRDAGMDAASAFAAIEDKKQYIHHWFTVDTLKYLARGGRISGSAALIGNVLDIKPVLYCNIEGKLIPAKKVKGRKRSLRELAEMFDELALRSDDELVGIGHADSPEDCELVAAMLKDRGVKDIVVSRIGALIGCHAGPDTIALFFFGPKREK